MSPYSSFGMFWQDVRFALRQLAHAPGFAAVAVLTLALGIGANTAVFSVVKAVLLAKPPYPQSEQLVVIHEDIPSMGEIRLNTSPAEYLDYRDRNTAFSSMGGYQNLDMDLTESGNAERIHAVRATRSLFDTLRVRPQIGHLFSSAGDRPNGPKVAVLAHSFWQQKFHSSPGAIGASLRLNEAEYTVIGVMPEGFEFPAAHNSVGEPPALWVPMAYSAPEIEDRAASFDTSVVARMKPGVTEARAADDVARIAAQFQKELPQIYGPSVQMRTSVEHLGADLTRQAKPMLGTLTIAVGFVLLIACANAANLLLARAGVRQHEIGLRSALGASAGRLARQLLTESIILTLMGGAAGCLLAEGLISFAKQVWPEHVVGLQSVAIDVGVLSFTMAISVATGLLCGLAPALTWSRPDWAEALKQTSARAGTSRTNQRVRDILVIVEAASAVVLLASAGLLIRSFVELLRVPPGFDAQGVAVIRTEFNRHRYPESERRRAVEEQILAAMRSVSSIDGAALATHLPLADERQIGISIDGRDPNEAHWINNALVSGNYFNTMRIPLQRGRTFDDRDAPDAPLAIVISQSMARHFWPGEDVIGKGIGWAGRHMIVVGVVGDVHISSLETVGEPMIYGDVFQVESGATSSAVFVIRSKTRDAAGVWNSARRAIHSVDSGLAVFGGQTLDQIVSRSVATCRFTMFVLSSFAALALGLTAIGVYGVLSYTVAQRTREMGVRLALGAQPLELLSSVIGRGLALVGFGLIAGLVLAAIAASAMSKLLFGIHSLDPLSFAFAAIVLIVSGALASYLPARRAARVDPMVALRYE